MSVPRSRFRNHPRTIFSSLGKLLMSLGISPISMFNLSFALVHLYILQLNTGISFAILRQVSQFCNFEVYVTRPKTKVNDMLTRREKAESITVSTRLPKASTIDKSCKCLPVTILTVLLKLGCSNIEETRNKISDSPRRRLRYGESQVGRAKRSSYFVFIATLCFLSVEARLPSRTRLIRILCKSE